MPVSPVPASLITIVGFIHFTGDVCPSSMCSCALACLNPSPSAGAAVASALDFEVQGRQAEASTPAAARHAR